MKSYVLPLTCSLFLSLTLLTAAYGADCEGPWQTIPNFKKSMGPACKAIGLDSRKGTCEPGHAYETLCDDMAVGKYRTCQGPRPCTNILPNGRDCRNWDYNYNTFCPEGYINYDCRGGCEPVSRYNR